MSAQEMLEQFEQKYEDSLTINEIKEIKHYTLNNIRDELEFCSNIIESCKDTIEPTLFCLKGIACENAKFWLDLFLVVEAFMKEKNSVLKS